MKKLLFFTVLILSLCGVNAQEISQNDKDALIALYNATDGPNWKNTWDLNDSPENWYGVVTKVVFGSSGAERHLDEINLSDNNLVGILPADLGNLKSLNVLNLSNNLISGVIPKGLGNAKDLNYLYLQNNKLNGDIPTELFTLNESHFVEINLSSNKLTGKLPVEIGESIANTGDVYVSNNLLIDLPDYTYVTLFRIKTLDISNNNIPFSVFERVPSFDTIVKVLEDNVTTLTYNPQNNINQTEEFELNIGANINFTITGLTSANNTYQWYKDGTPIGGATNTTYQITGTTLTDAGVYYCEVKNPNVPNLILKRNNITYNSIGAINDKNALITLYNATDGPNWQNTWDINTDMSTWKGVTVNDTGRVTELLLSFNKLTGSIPSEIGNLTNLTKLDLSFNEELTGNIPPEIGNLTKLTNLSLDSNNLTGSIPSEIGSLKNLTWLSLWGNNLTGNIPLEIWTLTSLTWLDLYFNKLTGDIPSEIGNLTKLTNLSLDSNKLTGNIPLEIGNLTNLTYFGVYDNELTGSIPSEIGNLTKLTRFQLYGNQLIGNIPPEIGNLTKLTRLSLWGNKLTGSIPSEIGSLSDLTELFLSNNELTGKIPTIFKDMPNLKNFSISKNNFVFKDLEDDFLLLKTKEKFTYQPQSKIDEEQNITAIEEESITLTAKATNSVNNTYQWRKDGIDITGATNRSYIINSLVFNDSGVYDCVIKNSIITDLTLYKNNVNLNIKSKGAINDKNALIALYNATDGPNWKNTWDINTDMSTWKGVTVNATGRVTKLFLNFNNLNGSIPSEIGNLTNLIELNLFYNQLTGSIPSEIGSLTNLTELSLSSNELTGSIPSEIGNLTNLIELNLFYNQLTGSIPSEIGNLTNLTKLSLSGNELTGSIPSEIGSLTNLETLSLSNNELTGSIPSGIGNLTNLTELSLNNNELTGSIPSGIVNLTSLTALYLSGNELIGSIPSGIGNLTNLTGLFLSNNELTGSIPSGIGNLTKLTELYLYYNQLTGSIPSEIGGLTNLETLYLSNNELTGKIPTIFKNMSNLKIFSISNNNFVFKDLEDDFLLLKTKEEFTYQSQSKIDEEQNITVIEEESITLTAKTTNSVNNSYQWRKDGIDITGATNRSYIINSLVFNDSGVYDCVIKNSIITDLTLFKNEIKVIVKIVDIDNDGVSDIIDKCTNTPTGEAVNANGCSESQLDDDNDGVFNNIDTCANTPNGEIVNTNGCSGSQLDDDNDGVFNNTDTCTNTPTGEVVNSDGCSESQLDDDNDGVFNNIDTCTNTPTGETVNANGCSESQLDDDNDGVFNNIDNCPNSITGSVVDANGCSIDQLVNIEPNDITVVVNSTTCPDKSNGTVSISFVKKYTYDVTLIGGSENRVFNNINTSLEISAIPEGTYEICVTIPSIPNFKQCYNVVITVPESLKVNKIALKGTSLTYQVSGSKEYQVTVNSKEYKYSFNDTKTQEIKVNLIEGSNAIEIKTNKICQGVFNKNIVNKGLILYPIPANNFINISGINGSSAKITITNTTGTVILSTSINVNNGVAKLPIDTIATGAYFITVTTSTQTINTKILKK